ncbi:MAG TPA: nitroreductase/quinone reductase family protein [Nitriliruptorales bacterium]|jgi:hypothetical protein
MIDRFSPSDLELLRDGEEVEIETRAAPDAPVHRAVIWIVVDVADRVLIRTWKGPGTRWYREVQAQPDCRLHVRGRVLDVRAVAASNPERVEGYSEAVQRKYARSRSTPSMLEPHVLPTTLELLLR